MAIVEMQINATEILFIMNTQNLSSANGQPFSVGSDNFNVASITPHPDTTLHYDEAMTFYVAYDEVTGPGMDAVNGKKTQLSRTYTVALNKVLQDAQGNITMVDGGSFDARVLLQIYGSLDGTAPTFVIVIDRIEPQTPNSQLGAAIAGVLAPLFPTGSVAIPLSAPLPSTYSNVGVAVNSQFSLVAFRIETGTGTTLSQAHYMWQAFFNGFIADHINVGGQQHAFSAFIPGDTVAGIVQASFDAGLAKHQDTFRFKYYYYVNWAPNNGTPGVNLSLNGDVLNACKPAGTDINYDVTGSVVLSLTPPDTIVSNGHLDWSGSVSDEIGCDIILGFDLAALFSDVGGIIAGPPGLVAGAIIGFVGGIIAGIIVMTVYVPDLPLPKNCSQSDHDFTCSQTLPLKIGTSSLQFSSLFGASDGLILAGELRDLPQFLSVKAELSFTPFQWIGAPISCADVAPGILTKIRANINQVARPLARASLTVIGSGSLKISDVKLVTKDPAGVVTPNSFTICDYGAFSEVDLVIQPNDTYNQNPYSFGLLITSNAGAFFASIPPAPPLDQAAIDQIMRQEGAQVSSCVVAADPWWQLSKAFNLKWLVDPPPDGTLVDRLRYVEVIGLASGQAVQLEGADGTVLAAATSASSGIAAVSHLSAGTARDLVPAVVRVNQRVNQTGPGAGLAAVGAAFMLRKTESGGIPNEIEISHRDEQEGQSVLPRRQFLSLMAVVPALTILPNLETPHRSVQVTYVECVPWATLRRGRAYSRLALGSWDGNAVATALAGETLDVLSLRDPARPILVRTMFLPDATGHLLAGGNLFAWGRRGLSRYNPEITRDQLLSKEPVLDAVAAGNILAVLHPRRLDVRSVTDGSHLASHELNGPRGIAATSRVFAVATERGLEVFVPVEGADLKSVAVNSIAGIRSLHSSTAVRPRTAVCVDRGKDSWSVIDLVDPHRARVIAQCHPRPWFVGAIMTSRLLARIGDDGSLSLSRIGRSLQSYRDRTMSPGIH
jgi:hypothetical protein